MSKSYKPGSPSPSSKPTVKHLPAHYQIRSEWVRWMQGPTHTPPAAFPIFEEGSSILSVLRAKSLQSSLTAHLFSHPHPIYKWIISNQSILKEISPGCSLEGLMLKLKLQYFGHLMQRADSFEKTLMLGKIEGRRRRGRQRMRWLC